jgi:glycosyltransferase involved in cell wall biosynthesis
MSRPIDYLLMAGHVPAGGLGGGIVRYTVGLAVALGARSDVRLQLVVNRDAADYARDLVPRARVHAVQKQVGGRGVLDELVGPLAPFTRAACGPVDVVHGVKHIVPVFTRGARSVLTVHDMLVRDRPRDYSRSKRLLLSAPYGLALTRADLLLCASAATRSRLLSYYPEVAGRATVVPLAASELDHRGAKPPTELVGRSFGLVVGDALPRKNVGFLGTVWAEVVRARPEFQLVVLGIDETQLAGQGPEWRRLLDDKTVICLAHAGDESLAWCYAHADAVLCPSYFEGFGLPAAEAAAAGAPIIISEDPALGAAAPAAARRLPSWDVTTWARAAVELPRRHAAVAPEGGPIRRWPDVAEDTIRAIREC